MKKKILLDVDSVLRNMVDKAIQVYNCFYDSNSNLIHSDIVDYDFRKQMPLIADLNQFFKAHAENVFYNARPYDGAIDFVKNLKKDGHDIHIVTNQLPGTEKYTLEWLMENQVPYKSLHFAKDKTILNGDMLIDDYVSNLEKCTNGVTPICVNQPWNQQWEGIRMYNYEQLRGYIRHMD